MAVTMIPLESSLQIVLVVGTSDNGDPIHKTRNYNKIKAEAAGEAVYEVGQELASLQQYPVRDIQRTTKSIFSES